MLSSTDSLTAARGALTRAAHRSAELMRSGIDPSAAVPGLTWNVGEVAAHMVADLREHTARVAGGGMVVRDGANPTVRGAEANRRGLKADPERRPAVLADAVEAAAAEFAEAIISVPAGEPIETANAVPMTPATLTAILLGEQLIHGLDLARSAHRPWPIDPVDALLVLPALMSVAPAYLDRTRAANHNAVYELRFGSASPRYHLTVANGTATTTVDDDVIGPDCVLTVDPVTFLLLGYGRTGRLAPVLRGKLRAGGRKPWLAGTFARLLTAP
jgi:uncharacterized protein (TIGR03083 family)